MAITATTIWRVRPSGDNTSGGGFDPSVSGVLATTLSGTLATGATSMTVTSDSGWPSSGNHYARLGATIGGQLYNELVLITSGQGTTTWTITRARLGTSDPGITWPAGTIVDNDFSQCNGGMLSQSAGTSNASTTFTNTGGFFNSTHVGNLLYLQSGTNAIVGWYIIQSVTNSTTIVLDRNCSTGAMTNGFWTIGGAWADPATNTGANIVPGNKIYILGSGIPNPASYTYDYTPSIISSGVGGSSSAGLISFIGDLCTPNYATGGRPVIKVNFLIWNIAAFYSMENLWFVASGTTNSTFG